MEDAIVGFWNECRRLNTGLEFLHWEDREYGTDGQLLSRYYVATEVGLVTMGFAGPVPPLWVDLLGAHFAQRVKFHSASVMAATGIHELKNPLAVLMGYMEILTSENPSPLVAKMDNLVQRIADGLEDLMAGFVSGYPHEDFDMALLAREVADEYQTVLAWHEITVQVTGEPAPYRGDKRQLRQVLRNLVHNAADAIGEQGTIGIDITSRGLAVVIDVSDDGAGIRSDIRPFLFRPYYTSKIEGHGLGLAFCKRVIDSHHGSILVKDLSPGTEFVITLPAQET